MSSGIQSGTPITNDLFSQALQHALQASGQPSLQVSLPTPGICAAVLLTQDTSPFAALEGLPTWHASDQDQQNAPNKGSCPCGFHSCTP